MRQSQNSGDNAVNIQAGSLSLGITYSDARAIAMDVFRENFMKLSDQAFSTAKERAEDFIDDFLEMLRKKGPEALESMRDPDVQRSVFLAQREYACNGDKVLGDVLVDMLSGRIDATERSIQQLSLSEALRTAPKLSSNHLATLSVLLILTQTRFGPKSVQDFHSLLRQYLLPVCSGLHLTNSDLMYIQYTGCLSTSGNFSTSIGQAQQKFHPGIFTNGFPTEFIPENFRDSDLIMPCFRDPEKLQVAVINEQLLPEDTLSPENRKELIRLMKIGLMGPAQIEAEIASIDPALSDLLHLWNSTDLKGSTLTTVGVTLGHANLRRTLGSDFAASLDTWVN
jgi:hypothetical protein